MSIIVAVYAIEFTMPNSEVQHIINEAKQGHQPAFTELLHLYWNDVYRLLASKTTNDYDTEDLSIRTFSKAFDKLHLYNDSYTFKNWLLTIANNLFIDHYRAHQNNPEVEISKEKVLKIPDVSLSVEDRFIQEQHLSALLHYLKQLKPHYREVIQLRYFQEYSIKEIADEINEPINNVKVKLLRAKKLLYEMMQKQ